MNDISLPIYDRDKCIFFALGRNAMYAACKILGIKEGDEILTPAFDCDGSLQPFRVLKAKLIFFKSDPDTYSVDIDDIRGKITQRTRLIHIINHFGLPQPWDDLLRLREEFGVPILEDNAYTLFSRYNGRYLGAFGDFSIFSLRKNLPIVDGGMLRINNPLYKAPLPDASAGRLSGYQLIGALNILKNRLGFYKSPMILRYIAKKINPSIEPPPPLYSDKADACPLWKFRDVIGKEFSENFLSPISPLALQQLSMFSEVEISNIINKKVFFYVQLSRRLKGISGITVMWPDLPKDVVPFCVSVRVASKRDIFLKVLRQRYNVMAWPTLSGLVIDRLQEFEDVKKLGKTVIQINLASEKVTLPSFQRYVDNLVGDIKCLSRNIYKN